VNIKEYSYMLSLFDPSIRYSIRNKLVKCGTTSSLTFSSGRVIILKGVLTIQDAPYSINSFCKVLIAIFFMQKFS
jgi:hypothetical protein